MYKSMLKIVIIFTLLNSCKEVKTDLIVRNNNDSIINFMFSPPIKLDSLPVAYRIKNNIFNWSELTVFIDAFENLSILNPEGIEVFIDDLDLKLKALSKSSFPQHLDLPDIKSRLKVVRTKLLQTKFHSKNKSWENLDLSLQELYLSYNSLIKRIKSINEEVNLFNKEFN